MNIKSHLHDIIQGIFPNVEYFFEIGSINNRGKKRIKYYIPITQNHVPAEIHDYIIKVLFQKIIEEGWPIGKINTEQDNTPVPRDIISHEARSYHKTNPKQRMMAGGYIFNVQFEKSLFKLMQTICGPFQQ